MQRLLISARENMHAILGMLSGQLTEIQLLFLVWIRMGGQLHHLVSYFLHELLITMLVTDPFRNYATLEWHLVGVAMFEDE